MRARKAEEVARNEGVIWSAVSSLSRRGQKPPPGTCNPQVGNGGLLLVWRLAARGSRAQRQGQDDQADALHGRFSSGWCGPSWWYPPPRGRRKEKVERRGKSPLDTRHDLWHSPRLLALYPRQHVRVGRQPTGTGQQNGPGGNHAQLGAWGGAVALIVGLLSAPAAFAGDDDEPDSGVPKSHTTWGSGDSRGLFDLWFGSKDKDKPKPIEKKPATPGDKDKDKDKDTEKPPRPAGKPLSMVDAAAAERNREQDTLLRRLQVCDKLTEIAFQTHDAELERTAEQLAERAQAAYSQRIAHLPCSQARFDSDENILEKHLGAGTVDNGHRWGRPLLPST